MQLNYYIQTFGDSSRYFSMDFPSDYYQDNLPRIRKAFLPGFFHKFLPVFYSGLLEVFFQGKVPGIPFEFSSGPFPKTFSEFFFTNCRDVPEIFAEFCKKLHLNYIQGFFKDSGTISGVPTGKNPRFLLGKLSEFFQGFLHSFFPEFSHRFIPGFFLWSLPWFCRENPSTISPEIFQGFLRRFLQCCFRNSSRGSVSDFFLDCFRVTFQYCSINFFQNCCSDSSRDYIKDSFLVSFRDLLQNVLRNFPQRFPQGFLQEILPRFFQGFCQSSSATPTGIN